MTPWEEVRVLSYLAPIKEWGGGVNTCISTYAGLPGFLAPVCTCTVWFTVKSLHVLRVPSNLGCGTYQEDSLCPQCKYVLLSHCSSAQ